MADEPMISPERDLIVVGVDGSEPSKNALLWGQFLAQATGATLEAVAAWAHFTTYGAMGAGLAAIPPDWNPAEDASTALRATVDEVFGDHRPAGLRLSVHEGNAAQVLIEASQNARLLVVGNRGHGGFAGLLLGSVSSVCSAHAACPVVVMRGDTAPPGLPDVNPVSAATDAK
ncbi:universal stress protein [Dermatophilaceae bacterium Sec6.4]|nr:universal stress protein [Actinomycetota bacterium]